MLQTCLFFVNVATAHPDLFATSLCYRAFGRVTVGCSMRFQRDVVGGHHIPRGIPRDQKAACSIRDLIKRHPPRFPVAPCGIPRDPMASREIPPEKSHGKPRDLKGVDG